MLITNWPSSIYSIREVSMYWITVVKAGRAQTQQLYCFKMVGKRVAIIFTVNRNNSHQPKTCPLRNLMYFNSSFGDVLFLKFLKTWYSRTVDQNSLLNLSRDVQYWNLSPAFFYPALQIFHCTCHFESVIQANSPWTTQVSELFLNRSICQFCFQTISHWPSG